MLNRDKIIDGLRALAMLQVIFVHVLYWGNYSSAGYIQIGKPIICKGIPLQIIGFLFYSAFSYCLAFP